MHNARIFVSSTCYDLAAVREDIRAMIIGMGHEPLLSEYSSFPVTLEDSAIANCRRNVREHTDVMVLIVGGKRGSIDPGSGKPVTNLEYEEALRSDIPIYVFFYRPVLNLVRAWQKNPDADFTPDVDYPAVFAFIERIRNLGTWTFSFERTEEIKDALRVQLSGLFRDLLKRRRNSNLEPLPEFSKESKESCRLALDKPEYWEYHLFAELLDNRLRPIRRKRTAIISGQTFVALRPISDVDFVNWMQTKFEELDLLTSQLQPLTKQFTNSLGPPGQPGNPLEILEAAESMAECAKNLVNWETEVLSIRPTAKLRDLPKTFLALRGDLFQKLESVPTQIRKYFEDGPDKSMEMNLWGEFEKLNFKPIQDEIERMNATQKQGESPQKI